MIPYDQSKCESPMFGGYSGCMCYYCRSFKQQPSKWVVVVHGGSRHGYEISLCREANRHGQNSYGWFDKDKILIAAADEWQNPNPIIFKTHKETARALCAKWNKKEGFK